MWYYIFICYSTKYSIRDGENLFDIFVLKTDNCGGKREDIFMDMLSVALDITTVVIIILITATSIKRGLITSIIEFVGGILSAVGSAF